jgi:hypothetical protein
MALNSIVEPAEADSINPDTGGFPCCPGWLTCRSRGNPPLRTSCGWKARKATTEEMRRGAGGEVEQGRDGPLGGGIRKPNYRCI